MTPPLKDEYGPSETAKWLKVSTNTIRNWCARYEDFLSDSANETPRTFTQHDMVIFKLVSDGVNNKQTHDKITEQLVEMGESIPDSFDTADVATEASETSQEPPQEPLPPAPMVDATALAPLLQAVQGEAIKGERLHVIEDEQRQQRTDINQIRWLLYAILLVMVLVLVAVVMLVAVMR